ncbi:hypothetical protein HS7_15520 [Sulfolobales archaeon HS-7]|nr:hypothetical protein HS7_15520 [Sulfolobales archaeon HS-7]
MRNSALDPSSIDVEILVFLSRQEKGRATNIARGTGLNPKSVWQALQRLVDAGLVVRDEFDVYTITDAGKEMVNQIILDKRKRVKLYTASLARHVDELTEEEIELLDLIEKKIIKNK